MGLPGKACKMRNTLYRYYGSKVDVNMQAYLYMVKSFDFELTPFCKANEKVVKSKMLQSRVTFPRKLQEPQEDSAFYKHAQSHFPQSTS